jgi:hypothetical protein
MGKASRRKSNRTSAAEPSTSRVSEDALAPTESPSPRMDEAQSVPAGGSVVERKVRLKVSDDEWRKFRSAAVGQEVAAGDLLGRLVRGYLADPSLCG